MTALRTLAAAAALAPLVIGPGVNANPYAEPDPARATLVGWSALPTETYVPGSASSGYWTTGSATVPAPYPGQPVQGFSATHALGGGDYLVMSDNGFGTKANSADFELAVHRIRPDLRTGRTAYKSLEFNLRDPARHIPWTIWRDGGCSSSGSLPSGYVCPAPDRILTGWDFDPESMQIAKDGTFWFGEEFGPYLLHTNDRGELLEPPIATPGVTSPSNPAPGGATPNLPNSKGYEGMAIEPNGRVLHPMLEGVVDEDRAADLGADLRIYTVANGAFEEGFLRYRMESAAHALGDFIMINGHQALVIERDNLQGSAAAFKRIYLADLSDQDDDGYVEKTLLVDLMDVRNPRRLGGNGSTFTFPYVTIEDVEIIDQQTIAVMNDNNFPAMGGRGADVPDVNELLQIRLDEPLKVHPRLLPRG
ncbi:esterase-like activity of phytase family protein [Nocardioides astragali]|uniref:Esterase-like activity of phytase family protein n=1 Tax=Nocardioides astragali TaxID=1776736 RepID=A0ABW2MYE7_9ACTN|nr:esterase-like activity of phytase family protein [Nocardioides astragali]